MQFGILVKNLYNSELNWRLLSEANNLIKENKCDIVFFYEECTPSCVVPLGSTMSIVEAYDYKYPLIATSLSNAQKLISFPRQDKSIFYMWDLEWMRFTTESFHGFNKIYTNTELKLVSRTDEHKDIFERIWNRKVNKVVEKCNLLEIIDV